MNKLYLITGATGHVGTVLVDRLMNRHESIRALVQNNNTVQLPKEVDAKNISKGTAVNLVMKELQIDRDNAYPIGYEPNPHPFVLMEDAYYHEEKIGNNVVFIGGGEVGVETAIYLCDHGKYVSVVEMQDILMPQASFEHYYALVAEQWETRENFDVYTKTKVIEIKEDGVLCETEGKQFLVPADTVVISSGFRSKTDETLEFGSCAPEYFYIGDCQRPRSLQAAMRDGFAIGSTI